MGKQVIIFSFVALTFVKALVIPLIYLDFNLRHDYIVKNLCVNRDRPQLNCDGKCYLAKKMAAAREQEQRAAEQNFITQIYELVAEPVRPLLPVLYGDSITGSEKDKTKFQYTSCLNGRLMISGLFRPPLAA